MLLASHLKRSDASAGHLRPPRRPFVLGLAQDLFNNEQGPVLGLHVKATQILADYAEDKQLTAAKDEYNRHQSSPTMDSNARKVAIGRITQKEHSKHRAEQTKVSGETQRDYGKS